MAALALNGIGGGFAIPAVTAGRDGLGADARSPASRRRR